MATKFTSSFIVSSFILTTIIVFLSEWVQKTNLIILPLGFRHIIVLFVFMMNWFFFGNSLSVPKKYFLGIVLICFYLIFAFSVSKASAFNYILGIFFSFLFVIIFILGINTKSKAENILTIFKGLLVFVFFMSIVPIIQGIVGGTTLRYLPGLFREFGAFGATMNIGTIIGLALYIITSKKIYLYFAIFFSLGVAMTILKKTMISNIIVWVMYFIFIANSRNKIKLLIYSFFFLLIGYFALGGELKANLAENQEYADDVGVEGHVRLGMYLASYNISKDYFPFGSGTGTFGSLASIVNGYSPLYYDYNVSNIGANSPDDVAGGHHTLLDTYWPHILGELGFIGSILFLFLWLFPLMRSFSIIRSNNEALKKGLAFYIIMIGISITWEGFTLYTPEIPAFILLHSGLTGLCYFHLREGT